MESWEPKKLSEIGKFQYGFTATASAEEVGPKFLRISDISENGEVDWSIVPYCIIDGSNFKRYELKNGDILFARIGATAGKACYIDSIPKAIFASYLIRFKVLSEVYSKYVFYFTQSDLYWTQALRSREGQLKKGLNANTLAGFVINLPDLKEQKAIAQILSTVDEGIQKVDEAIKRTERFKQGLMQRLLTEGIGHTEFKKFHNKMIPKSWKVLSLEKITLNITDGKHGDCTNENNSGYYFISAKDIFNGKINYENARHITWKDFEDAHRRTKLEPNDILLTNSGSIGKTALVIGSKISEKTTFQKSVAIIKPNRAVVITEFLLYTFFGMKKYLEFLANGTSQKNLLLKDLRALNIPLPSLPEQKRIAAIMIDVDMKLELEKQRKQKLEKIKKGLMNDLLTGKKRVKVR